MTKSAPGSGHRLGTDIGGTFTDFVAVDSRTGEIRLEKTLTTPDDPARGIFNGVQLLAERHQINLADADTFVHGTTLVINALIERKGARTALFTTSGFRDILEMRSETRFDVYDLQLEYPTPLVSRRLRFEVTERTDADGKILVSVDEQEVEHLAQQLIANGIEALAVVFLHAYANGTNERRVGQVLARCAPEVSVSLSCDVLPQIKEYERTSTTVANAFVKPLVRGYLDRLASGLESQGFRGALHVMQSDGGVLSRDVAQSFPIRMLESGPAGGVEAARWWGRLSGAQDLLCFDMGGTTAKLCTVIQGEAVIADTYEAARTYQFKSGSGIAVNVPVYDLLEIGTGGGSIARIDSLGLVKVGPRSAGASPGPAAYGRGGSYATVTDADVVLGLLDPRAFLGGTMPLDMMAARTAIANTLATPLGLSIEEAALGIHDIANEDMACAARLHLAERGEDPANLTLVAYGGAGPVHAFGLAEKLGMRRILVPPAAGVMSALGMLVSDISITLVRTWQIGLESLDVEGIQSQFASMAQEAAQLPGAKESGLQLKQMVDVRYRGQGYHLCIPWPKNPVESKTLRDAFESSYRARYGRAYSDVPAEIVNLRLSAVLPQMNPLRPPVLAAATGPVTHALSGQRFAMLGRDTKPVLCPVYDRYKLGAGHRAPGPAFIEERETTTTIGASATFQVDTHGIIVIEREP